MKKHFTLLLVGLLLFFANASAQVGPIVGPSTVCVGDVVTYTDSTTGGVWLSLNPAIATIGSTSGILTALSPGVDTITYFRLGLGGTSKVITVNPVPIITGPTSVVAGSTITLAGIPGGGTWSSACSTILSINPTTGVVTGIAPGICNVVYTLPTGCATHRGVRVDSAAPPAPITGPSSTCQGSTATLSDSTAGGTWSSSNTSIATVGATTGVVTGVTAGSVTITYTVGASFVTYPFTVNATPVITGPATLCVGSTITLTGSPTGGTWFSSTPSVATVTSAGLVTGITPGTTTIFYNRSGCIASHAVTVTPGPAPISGPGSVSIGGTVTLTDATPGGFWFSSAPSTALIGSTTGIVTGISAGTCLITYYVSGCITTISFTVTPTSSIPPITGGSSTCVGSTVLLSNATPGGIWTSSNTAIAMIGATSGVVTGISPGVVTITYTVGSSFVTTTFTVFSAAVISGINRICVGSSTLFTATPTGGIWNTGNPSIATVNSSGVVTGVSPGVVNIYYTSGGCYAFRSVTVNAVPVLITGITTTTVGGTSALSNATPGGTWSSSNPAIAAVGSSTGLVTGVSAGTCVITYAIGSCIRTVTFTVTTLTLPAILGPTGVCVGATVTLTNAASGGTWTSSNTAIATIGAGTGVVTGVSAGVVTITYTIGSSFVTRPLAVLTTPAPITGTPSTTVGGTSTLSNSVTGGTWSSSNTSIATVNPAGVVTGISAGTCTITYSIGSCFRTITFSVTSTTIAPILGPTGVCVGATVTLTSATPGGTWSSSNTSIAAIGATTGVVTGVSAGVVTITYTVGSSFVTRSIAVLTTPAPITGVTTVSVGGTSILSSTPSGGTWSSSNPAIASVGSTTSLIVGVSAGTCTITYTVGGCFRTLTFTVTGSTTIAPILGPTGVCVGATVTLTSATPGGTWTSSNTSIAAIGATTGVVVGVSAGVATITYTVGSSFVTRSIAVLTTPAAITGTPSTTVGGTSILSNAVSGGTWSSSNTAIATVNTAGVVTGVSVGTCTITYAIGSCFRTVTFTVTGTTTIAPITGPMAVCLGSTITLTSATPGGTWSSSNTSIAVIGASSGVVSGISAGTVTITYTVGSSFVIRSLTVTGTVSISGPGVVCSGSTITLSATPTGGSWASSSTAIATVGTAGVVTGVSPGVTNIYYNIGGCFAYKVVTVNPAPAITGSTTVCIGSVTTLFASMSGGTWSSSNTSIATVSSSGVVTPVSAGTVNISYTLGGCSAIRTITVTSGATISGSSTLCVGTTITLSATPSGGTWTSSNPSRATVSSTGIVTGISTGAVSISYSVGGCTAVKTVTVSLGAVITGSSVVCIGSTTTLTASPGGGTWISSNTSVATVSSTGVVTGVGSGVVNIYYSVSGGCSSFRSVTVNAAPIISGGTTACLGTTLTLFATPGGGTWASGDSSIATVSPSGVVTTHGAGTVNIYYTVGGCSTFRTLTVTAGATISGSSTVCIGSSTTLTATPSGGTWTSSNTAIAIISSSGVVTGITGGVVIIYYSAGGCSGYKAVTVNAAPVITGSSTVCVGSTTALTASPSGGTWSVTSTAVATISSSGVVTGVTTGVATVTYSIGGCMATRTITVNATSTITGSSVVCTGSSITLTGSPSGGTWASGFTYIATVSSSGVVTGVTPGTITIYYSLGGCYAFKSITVNPSPAPIAGPGSVCVGASIALSDATSGGTWSSANTTVATVSTSGIVTGVSAGIVTIDYTVGGCSVFKSVTVNPVPVPIVGPSTVIVGTTIVLTDATPGGSWFSSNPSIATVNPSTGVVTGVSVGSVVIYYSIGSCSVYKVISVRFSGFAPGLVSKSVEIEGADDESRETTASKNTATGVANMPGSTEGIVKVYPNPTTGNVNIQWQNQDAGTAQLLVMDVIGRTVFNSEISITAGSGHAQFNLSDLKDGVYLVTIRSESIHYSSKLIINK